jgi:hypothetical protein
MRECGNAERPRDASACRGRLAFWFDRARDSRGGRGAGRLESDVPPRPAEDAERGGKISPLRHQRFESCGWRGAMRGCSDLDPAAVLRVSFLRGLRVLRVKLRRAGADRGSSLCSPCSLREPQVQIPRLAPLARDDGSRGPSRQGVRALGLRPRGLTPPPAFPRSVAGSLHRCAAEVLGRHVLPLLERADVGDEGPDLIGREE